MAGGAGGFIGHPVVSLLKSEGFWVRGVDIEPAEYAESGADEFLILDLREPANCVRATEGHQIYQLAAEMGAWATSARTTRRWPAAPC